MHQRIPLLGHQCMHRGTCMACTDVSPTSRVPTPAESATLQQPHNKPHSLTHGCVADQAAAVPGQAKAIVQTLPMAPRPPLTPPITPPHSPSKCMPCHPAPLLPLGLAGWDSRPLPAQHLLEEERWGGQGRIGKQTDGQWDNRLVRLVCQHQCHAACLTECQVELHPVLRALVCVL
jgi:hypothetical protein